MFGKKEEDTPKEERYKSLSEYWEENFKQRELDCQIREKKIEEMENTIFFEKLKELLNKK